MKIWIDADSCPIRIREIIEKASLRTKTPLIFAANRLIPHGKSTLFEDIILQPDPDSADNYITDNAASSDIVITRDIPLAQRLVEKDIKVINDRGNFYTPENIKERLSIRNFMHDLRESGFKTDTEKHINQKDVQKFANTFDSLLTKMINQEAK